LFYADSATFQLYHGENKLIFNEMRRSTLYYTNMLSWTFIVLAHWNNSPWINMLPHSNTLSSFWANQSLLYLLNAACLAEKQQILILKSLILPDWDSNPRSTSLETSMLTITPLMNPWSTSLETSMLTITPLMWFSCFECFILFHKL
jgi:hypothetical protein